MEKLIELLNECKGTSYRFGVNGDNSIYQKETDAYGNVHIIVLPDYKLISKQFGFIKWLVENEKIDRDKCGFKNEGLRGNWYDSGIAFVQNYDNDTFKISEFYSPYLQLLMLLSISNSPIDDLISYLK